MATKLDKSIKRELELDGRTYTITIAPEGVKVVEKGKRNGPEVSWRSIVGGGGQGTGSSGGGGSSGGSSGGGGRGFS